MSNSLYQITNEFNEIVSQLEEYELDQETFQSTLDSLTLPIEQKVENIVKYMKSLEALAEAKKAEAKRLSESAASDLKKAEWFKNYMADNLKKANITKLQAGIFQLGWKKGSEVTEVDVEKLPKHILSADKTALITLKWEEPVEKTMTKPELKKLIKAGLEIPGVTLVRNEDTLVVK